MANPVLRCGVAGVGSLGQHHVRIYTSLPGVEFAGFYEANDARAAEISARFGARRFATLAEMAARIAVARQYYLHAARLLEAGLPCAREAAAAKLFATDMAEQVCSDALQTFGGYGYLEDFPVERYCRDVRVCRIYEGTSDIQKLIISRSL